MEEVYLKIVILENWQSFVLVLAVLDFVQSFRLLAGGGLRPKPPSFHAYGNHLSRDLLVELSGGLNKLIFQ